MVTYVAEGMSRPAAASKDQSFISPLRRAAARVVTTVAVAPRSLIAIVVLGTALRFATLGSQSYWYD